MKVNSVVKSMGVMALLGVLAASANAQTYRNNINNRLSEQEMRIRQGLRSGQLTPREAQRLRERDIRISFAARRAHITGGRMTAAERARLEAKLNRNSRAIARQKHDRQHRW